ncbi:hypothetical protein BGZ98_005955 [Dissophora globulifera]|nr:hypothetical protein BGZ98_005955 [Dissophora globulifera]
MDSSAVYAALSSTLMASLVFCPQDTVIRMAEESRRPERTMPMLIVGSSISNLLAGLPLIIVLNYGVIKPIKGLLNDPVPCVRVIVETLGDYSGTVFVSMVLVAMFSTGVIRLSMATRTVYAFARDGGVPHSSYWNHLHPQRKTPQRVSWLVTVVCMGCIFPYFWGNTVAFRWIASLGCISANICFGSLHFIPGNFTLGRFSRPLHIVSIIWLLALSLFLMFPPTFPLSKNNFNYAPVVLIVLSIVFGVSWFKARTDFTGGAKDISRASHRIPSQDHSPRKQHYFELETLGSDDGTRLSHQTRQQQQASLSTLHKLRSPVVEKSKARYGHNIGTNSGSSNRSSPLSQNIRRPPLSLTSSTRRNHADISASALVPKRRQRKQHKISPETASKFKLAGHPQRGQLGSNLTMTSMASNQSHPSSILGIPFSESPEMMHLTKGDGRALPEIKIASPMTDSTVDETTTRGAGGGKAVRNPVKHRKAGVQQQETAPVGSKFPPAITFRQDGVFNLSSMSSGTQVARPANAIDSIFKQGLGLSDQLTGKKSDASGMLSDYGIRQGKPRSGKDRAPTPYPASIVDGDDGGISDYTGSMVDTAHLFSASTDALPTLHLKHGKKYEGTAKNRMGKPSTEEVVSGLDILLPFESVSRFPTLDGYPLLKSPTTEYMDVKTPTIELGDHEHGALFKMEGGSDSEGIGNFSDALAADDSYETEYNNYYPVISILKSRLHALTTVNASFQASSSSSSLFRLPNRDISAAAGEVPLSSFIPSSGSGGEGESSDAATATRSRPLPPLPVQKQDQDKRQRQQPQQRQSEERHDPIERLLNLNLTLQQHSQPHQNAHSDQQLQQEQQQQQQLSDPTQQQLQRTRSVASWAQEQALIQEKRAMHRARIEALKELRKHDPGATLSMYSDDSFEFSEVLSLSSPPWSSSTASAAAVGVTRSPTHSSSAGGKSRKSGLPSKQNQMANSSALEPLSEDDSLHLSRLEIVVREQEKDEDEQPGIYADTDDLLSPSIEVESLGAGVGKPSFRK